MQDVIWLGFLILIGSTILWFVYLFFSPKSRIHRFAKEILTDRIKVLSLIALIGFLVSVLFAPWERLETEKDSWRTKVNRKVEFAPLFAPPASSNYVLYESESVRLVWQSLVLTWVSIGAVYGIVFLLIRPKSPKPKQTFAMDDLRN